MSGEFNNNTVGSQKCTYSPLNETYGSRSSAKVTPGQTSGQYVVPEWGQFGNGYVSLSLSGDKKSCTGYATMENAYGSCDAKFGTRSCS